MHICYMVYSPKSMRKRILVWQGGDSVTSTSYHRGAWLGGSSCHEKLLGKASDPGGCSHAEGFKEGSCNHLLTEIIFIIEIL